MKWLLLILVPVLAFAAKWALIDNLSDTGVYEYDWACSSWGGTKDFKAAFDYDPDGVYIVDEIVIDWVYYQNTSSRDDMNFEIYLEDFDDPPIIAFMIPEADYSETDTGFTYAGRDVYRGNIPLGGEAFETSTPNKYWIALQMDSDDGVYAAGRIDSVIGEFAWYHYSGTWYTYGTGECSYALYSGGSGVRGASLGEIKALFK